MYFELSLCICIVQNMVQIQFDIFLFATHFRVCETMHDKSMRVYAAHGAHSWTYAKREKLWDTPSIYLRITYTATMRIADSDDVNQMYKWKKNKGKNDKTYLLLARRAIFVWIIRIKRAKKGTEKKLWKNDKYKQWTHFTAILNSTNNSNRIKRSNIVPEGKRSFFERKKASLLVTQTSFLRYVYKYNNCAYTIRFLGFKWVLITIFINETRIIAP